METFIQQHRPQFRAYARRLDANSADDLVGETELLIWRFYARYDPSLWPLLWRRTMRNVFYSDQRSSRVRHESVGLPDGVETRSATADHAQQVAQRVDTDNARRRMTPRERQISERVLNDASYAEIENETGLNRTQHYRARQAMRRHFGAGYE